MNFKNSTYLTQALQLARQNEFEKAYIYYRRALFLAEQDEQIRQALEKIFDSQQLDEYSLEKESGNVICEEIEGKRYQEAFDFLTELLFDTDSQKRQTWCSNHNILWYILLEATLCEQQDCNYEESLSIQQFSSLDYFNQIYTYLKLRVLGILYSYEESYANEYKQFVVDNHISPYLLAVITKYASSIVQYRNILQLTADMFVNDNVYYATVLERLLQFGTQQIQCTRLEAVQKFVDNRLEYRYIDAREMKTPSIDKWDSNTVSEADLDSAVDDQLISFIMCANNELYVKENLRHLRQFVIPAGYRLEVLIVLHATGMAAGYNLAMKCSYARYKVYIHQDTIFTDRDALIKIIEILNNEKEVHMLGVAGTDRMPDDKIWWNSADDSKYMNLYQDVGLGVNEIKIGKAGQYYVQALDGIMLATDKDVLWREDLFDGWHFYDISACSEYRKLGYGVAVAVDYKPWLWHKLTMTRGIEAEYEKYCQIYKKEYKASETIELAFIIAESNKQYLHECIRYIQMLELPENCSIDILHIEGASSIVEAYDAAMLESSARYKIYLHEDYFITDRYFISNILNVFESNRNIGILGITNQMEDNNQPALFYKSRKLKEMILITQYDIPWVENETEIDIAGKESNNRQCMKFEMRNYSSAMPLNADKWGFSDADRMNATVLSSIEEIQCNDSMIYGQTGYFDNKFDQKELVTRYNDIKFLLYRIELGIVREKAAVLQLISYIKEQSLTVDALNIIMKNCNVNCQLVWDSLKQELL